MDLKKTVLCESLIIWLQTFKTAAPCKTVEDLTSGAAMSQALHQIDPSWFSESWLARIKEDVGDNVRLKMNNLKKILQMIVDYYNEVLAQQMSDFPLPDLMRVVEQSDQVELGRLLQLILGCAVKCDRKQEYIQIIMTLEESVQHVVMTAIQELMSRESVSQLGAEPAGDTEQQLKKALEDLTEVMAEKEELAQRCQELDMQVTVLQEERNSLLAENDLLTDRSSQLETFDDPSTPSGRKHSQLQFQLEQLQEENFRLEAAKDDYRIHCEELEKQLVELQHRNDELTSLAEESRSLKDELDILRSCSDRAVKLEASVETYRKKLEDLSDLRRQMKALEEKNMTYMHNTVSLEEELRKANAARAQLETYKRQVQELHKKLSDESRRADNLVFEMKKLQEKYDALVKERERISIERDTLRETNEELRCTQAQQDQLLLAGKYQTGSPSHDNLAAEMLPIEYREKFIRLQHENKMLRLQQEESEKQRITELQQQLEEARRGRSQLDTDNRLNRERISELQQQVEDLQKALQTQGAKPDDSHLKRKLDAHMVQLNEAQDEIMKKKELLEDLQPDATQTSVKMDELMAALKKKDEDMRAMEDRYKMYLEKARDVIRALDPKLNPASAEIQSLKVQLSDKDKKIIALERECEQAKLREYEEKLIVTAWYNKSLNFQKMAIESRLSGRANSLVPPGQSFLAQQRQVTNARRTMSINVPASSSK
ncbi:protein Hook homolog 1 [Danio rerio]|uniref:Protein Hook homolog 1 n=1 Tax=Danio rerio TaxID=7955 RepID=HOOK1_DANRE|nr:protein Hook homolog 1 [Danio rerio]Q5TZ80.1 RecName: Full=Protein Hook homolog 1 [Danio rerio]|eukprot:NP_001038663.1 protein Hook homolog 1 [Danio rerio]